MRYLVGDTETTGLGSDRAAVEVGLIEIAPDTLEILGEMSSIVNPLKPIDPRAAAIHGISDEEAAKHPTLPEYIQNTLGGPLEGEITLIAYNVRFDLPLLRPFGNITATLDVLAMARRLVQGVPNYKLQTLKSHYSLPDNEAHRALGDCRTTLQLFRILVPLSGRSLQMHCTPSFQMVHTCPWGLHAGKALHKVPISYRAWMLTRTDLDPDLRTSLEILSKTE